MEKVILTLTGTVLACTAVMMFPDKTCEIGLNNVVDCKHTSRPKPRDLRIFLQQSSEINDCRKGEYKKIYILYEVNVGEGFNLRRDVFMRVASLVSTLRHRSPFYDWQLVLPPWGPLYHWQSINISAQTKIPWKTFFDVQSLNLYVPVLEFSDYLRDHGPQIDIVYYLQNYENWTDEQWQERFEHAECINSHHYEEVSGKYIGWFWGFSEVHSTSFKCVSVLGHASTLLPLILDNHMDKTAIMIDRAEIILHDEFGGVEYWKIRRSMRFADHLIKIANEFRHTELNSTDDRDRTIMYADWRHTCGHTGEALGGPYLAIHLRRKDFLLGRKNDIPTLKEVAQKVKHYTNILNLTTVFVATDAPEKEYEELRSHVGTGNTLVRFTPTRNFHIQYKDGGVAIVDQWICAHSRYFVGTRDSTFTFRIQEEREILGFHSDTTFNHFCGDEQKCELPAKWRIQCCEEESEC